MSAPKVAEVRCNTRNRLVQIKMNRGPNHILRGEQVSKFEAIRDEFLNAGGEREFADLYAANTYLKGV